MPAATDETVPNGTSNGVNGVNGAHTNGSTHSYDTASTSSYSIPMSNDFAYAPRKLRVVTIGAGFSGLMIAHKFQHRFPEMQEYVDHVIYEGHTELGGTWLVNTYP